MAIIDDDVERSARPRLILDAADDTLTQVHDHRRRWPAWIFTSLLPLPQSEITDLSEILSRKL